MRFEVGLSGVALLALLLLSSPGKAALPSECAELGLGLTEHSCFHAFFGPYVSVRAVSGVPDPEAAPGVDAVHTYYDVELPNPSRESSVSYRVAAADRAGEWALFHDPRIPLRVLAQDGTELVPLLEHDVPSCEYLPRASVFSLGDERYRIVLGPAPVARALLVIENVTDFVTRNGRDADGDGYGDPNDTQVTLCVPREGYVPDATDCDDANPRVHPGATELCDGVDQNCNGVADDERLPCSQGRGECAARGRLSCTGVATGRPAVCDATALTPSLELCDGLDSDCDGDKDDKEEGVCVGEGSPRCILAVGRWACGCGQDSDCGGPGRLCRDSTRTCIDGCLDLPGRNGCPAGWSCTSDKVNRPGECVPPPCTGPGCGDASSDAGVDAGTLRVEAGNPDGGSPAPLPASEPRDGGCACSMASRSVPTDGGLAALVAATVLAARRRRARRVRRTALAGIVVTGLTACGGLTTREASPSIDATAPQAVTPPDACVDELGPNVIEHACRHGQFGPFADVVALASPGDALSEVSLVHHAYRVVPEEGASGHVYFVPRRDGEHVIFTSQGDPTVLDSDGQAVGPLHVQEVRGCDVFQRAQLFSFRPGQGQVLRVGGSADETTLLFVEHMGTFGQRAWVRCEE
ncbi:MAG: putative metal-binding motif-containing protein [Deltaproteobacteria bacterium]|nr:putative metal-binding motif-containing protein [Deltaproteobacteria bacterium]